MLTLTQDTVTEGLGLCRVHVAGEVGEAGTVSGARSSRDSSPSRGARVLHRGLSGVSSDICAQQQAVAPVWDPPWAGLRTRSWLCGLKPVLWLSPK